ncbi:mini-chromosome maintenance complex-binding protein-like [Saccostrea cucullata]|uniref:mini-chromosome maintenance complex-binding protein-like n=1 Tax=Saccostrea cuccullata TaxID=36930 RepID=UPI002ED51BD7
MPGVEDWTTNPLGIVQSIYDKHGSASSEKVQEYFHSKTNSETARLWIPSLNDTPLHCLLPNSLVRYRCMVQDMFDPEFYMGEYEVSDVNTKATSMKSGKYKDIAECAKHQEINMDSDKNVTMERQTLYCVPIPGETEWVKSGYSDKAGKKSFPTSSVSSGRTKRGLEEEEPRSDTHMEEESEGTGRKPEDTTNKRPRPDSGEGSVPRNNTDLNFPLHGEKGMPCLVKIYEDMDGFAVNDMVEFIGVLSVDPSLAHFHEENRSDGIQSSIEGYEEPMEEKDAHAPPPSLVPRLHALVHHKLKHNNPHVSTEKDKLESDVSSLRTEIFTLRRQILSALEQVMLGDSLAAEYFLCHLISSVYGRADVMPLGKFSLNITHCPPTKEYGQLIHTFMEALTTKCHFLPLSIENMNNLRLCPEKDYTANRLKSGVLQLSADTSLIIDETQLQPGQLEAVGVRNITALGNLISWQKVEYDFRFHRQDFLSNVSVLILSEAKSILPSDCLVPMNPACKVENLQRHFSQLDVLLTPEFLGRLRSYLTICKLLEYTIDDTMQKSIQDDFVEIRKTDPKSMSVDDFHTLLNLVRLLSLSAMETAPTQSTWEKAKTMESERKRRILMMNNSQ